MKYQNQKGFVIPLIIAIATLIAVGGGVYLYNVNQTNTPIIPEDDFDWSSVNEFEDLELLDNEYNQYETEDQVIFENEAESIQLIEKVFAFEGGELLLNVPADRLDRIHFEIVNSKIDGVPEGYKNMMERIGVSVHELEEIKFNDELIISYWYVTPINYKVQVVEVPINSDKHIELTWFTKNEQIFSRNEVVNIISSIKLNYSNKVHGNTKEYSTEEKIDGTLSNAAAKTNLSNSRLTGEIYYDRNNSYEGLCKDKDMKKLLAQASKNVSYPFVCNDSEMFWVAEIKLKTDEGYFCVDSSGMRTTSSHSIVGGPMTQCPRN